MTSLSSEPFGWHQYLELATVLKQDPSEAHQRTAISRAYYAAFHAAREALRRAGDPASRSPSHELVWAAIERLRKAPGIAGGRLRRQRNVADYDHPSNQAWSAAATMAVATAKNLIGELQKL